MTDKELDEFIEDAERIGSDTWWITDFCDEAMEVAKELRRLRTERRELLNASN